MSEVNATPAVAPAASTADIVPAAAPAAVVPSATEQAAEEEQPKKFLGKITYPSLLKLVLLLTLVGGLVVALTVGDLDSRIGDVFDWIDDNRVPGIFIFFAVYVGVTSVPLSPLPASLPHTQPFEMAKAAC